MKIEVKAVTYYTVELTEEDVEKIKDKLSKDYFYKTDISDVIFELYKSGEISLYDDGKCVESDFYTDEIYESEFEKQTWEEVFWDRIY